MSKRVKVWLVIVLTFVLVGGIFCGVMAMLNWDFAKLSTVKYETNNYTITEDFSNISVKARTANIVFAPSVDETASVVCYENAKIKHNVCIEDGALVITRNDTRKWYEHIGFDFHHPKITVYLPKGEYGTLSIQTSTGDIGINGISAEALHLTVSTGDVSVENTACNGDVGINVSTGKTILTNVQCGALLSEGDTGNITLTNVIASGKFDIERDTGNVKLYNCDAEEIYIETDTGNITGTLLSEKVFIPRSKTGDIDVPKTIVGGRCEIETDTGDIKITLSNSK